MDLSATSMTTIPEYAFDGAASLTSVTFPSSLTTIAQRAFQNSGLSSVDLSGCTSMTTISQRAFSDTASLSSVKFPASLTSVGSYAFQNSGLSSVDLSTYTSLTIINTYAFDGCTALISIQFPTSLTSVGNYAFRNTGLTSVTFPASLESIGNYAFQNTADLEWVKWPASGSNAYVGTYAFSGAAKLSRVELPNNLLTATTTSCSIRQNAFTGTNLRVLILRTEAAGIYANYANSENAAYAFPDTDFSIYVPDTKVSDYKEATGWSTIADKIVSINTLQTADEPGNW
jgi:hypothetical protein